jgi:hypothetical protein
MTIAELQRRVEALEADVRELRARPAVPTGADRRFGIFPGNPPVSEFGPVGGLADDPDFDEFTRLVREERERVNRESLEEFDRERQAEAKKKRPKKAAKPVRR